MKEEFVSNGLARKLLAKGCPLDRVCKADEGRPLFYELPLGYPEWQDCDAWYAPTIAQVLGWLRDEKKLYISIEPHSNDNFSAKVMWTWDAAYINSDCKFQWYDGEFGFDTYEKAAVSAIENVIDNLI